MQLEVLTPDEEMFKGEVNSITLPGLDGYFGVLDHHAPIIAALSSGNVTLKGSKNASGTLINNKKEVPDNFDFEIKGGMIEMKNNNVVILAD